MGWSLNAVVLRLFLVFITDSIKKTVKKVLKSMLFRKYGIIFEIFMIRFC